MFITEIRNWTIGFWNHRVKKKHCSSLHFGDCYIQNYPFMATHKLQITTKTVNDQKRKIRTLQQQVLRLKKKSQI